VAALYSPEAGMWCLTYVLWAFCLVEILKKLSSCSHSRVASLFNWCIRNTQSPCRRMQLTTELSCAFVEK
jgi:hypothetical protein